MAVRRWALGLVVWLGVVLSGLVLGGAWAHAALTHKFLPEPSNKISEGVPAGCGAGVPEPPCLPGALGEVNALTADSGHVWVAERLQAGGSRVDRFDASSGEFLAPQLDAEEGVSFLETGVAIGNVTGEEEVYVAAGQRLVAVFGQTGKLQHAWTGANTPTGSFTDKEGTRVGILTGVAVDGSVGLETTGDVYVSTAGFQGFPEFNVVDVFSPKEAGGKGEEPGTVIGTLTGTPSGPFNGPTGVAVSDFNGDVLVADGNGEQCANGEAECVVDVFEPVSGMPGVYSFLFKIAGAPQGLFKRIGPMAVDASNGTIYVAEKQSNVVDEFDKEGKYLGRLTGIPSGQFKSLQSVAIDPLSHHVFVGDLNGALHAGSVDIFGEGVEIPDVETLPASNETPTGVQLNGRVDPLEAETHEEATCQFLWGTSESLGSVVPCVEPVKGSGFSEVHRQLEGLQPGTRYFYRLQATNGNGTNSGEEAPAECEGKQSVDACFQTPGPGLHDQWVSELSSTAATLNAHVDPHGNPTEVIFEYGASTKYGSAVSQALGSGVGDVHAEVHVQSLTPSTVYHYRVVAVSELEVEGTLQRVEATGPDQTFTTQGAGGGLVLPDGRGWELVSPPDKRGAKLEAITEAALVQASSSGGAVSYLATVPTEASVLGYTVTEQIFSTRGAGGWSSKDISPPHAAATGVSIGVGGEYRSFSEDLSLGVVEPQGEFTSLAPETSPPDTERTPYIRHDTTCDAAPAECFQPLVTSAPGFADVPPGTEFGGDPTGLLGGVNFIGASPDLAHVILTSKVALTSTPASGNMLYEFSAGSPPFEQLRLISVLPNGEPANTITELGYQNKVARHAVSDDGSRIVWSEPGGDLYLREKATRPQSTVSEGKCTVPADACTVKLDAGLSGTPTFQTANSEVSEVFFTDGGDLYRYNVADSKLEAVTKAAEVQGLVLGSSDDSSYVYFVANGVLGDGAEHGAAPGSCKFPERAGDGTCNLYVWHGGVTRLIAVLSGQDVADWAGIELDLSFQGQTSRVSASGRYLAFMSNRSLTGYDNRDANSGKPDEEVYLYHAPDSLETQSGTLTCASCNPTGARPTGVEYDKLGNGSVSLVGGDRIWNEHTWLAANIPAWTAFQGLKARYQSRYLSDSGRLFFNSSDALAPQDVNKNEDVYEYEAAGLSGCAASSPTFNAGANGCVGLITSGSAAGESAFLDASENGNDVFFLTGERLVPQDIDTSLDVYDAHVCAAASPCFSSAASPPACTTADACRSAPAPQPSIFGAPSSATFSGAGNVSPPPPPKPPPLTRKQRLALALKACHKKHNHRRRVACEKQAHKRYGTRKRGRA
jgi:hypothetical protein